MKHLSIGQQLGIFIEAIAYLGMLYHHYIKGTASPIYLFWLLFAGMTILIFASFIQTYLTLDTDKNKSKDNLIFILGNLCIAGSENLFLQKGSIANILSILFLGLLMILYALRTLFPKFQK